MFSTGYLPWCIFFQSSHLTWNKYHLSQNIDSSKKSRLLKSWFIRLSISIIVDWFWTGYFFELQINPNSVKFGSFKIFNVIKIKQSNPKEKRSGRIPPSRSRFIWLWNRITFFSLLILLWLFTSRESWFYSYIYLADKQVLFHFCEGSTCCCIWFVELVTGNLELNLYVEVQLGKHMNPTIYLKSSSR